MIKLPRLASILSWFTLMASAVMLLPLPHYFKMVLWGSAVLLFFLARYRSRPGVIVAVWLLLAFIIPEPRLVWLPDLLRFVIVVAAWSIVLAVGLLLIKRRLKYSGTISYE